MGVNGIEKDIPAHLYSRLCHRELRNGTHVPLARALPVAKFWRRHCQHALWFWQFARAE